MQKNENNHFGGAKTILKGAHIGHIAFIQLMNIKSIPNQKFAVNLYHNQGSIQ